LALEKEKMGVNLPSVLRLERYASVLTQFEGQEEIPLSSFLLALMNISAEQMIADFSQLGISYDPIKQREAQQAVRAALAEVRAGDSGTLASRESLQTAEIERKLMESAHGTVQQARIAEAAWNFVVDHSSMFLLSLGRMQKGEVPFPHQLLTTKSILEVYGGTALVADEVGLGKTLIGALLVFEILERRPDARVLILTPANLLRQWVDEFYRFFGFDLKEVPTMKVGQLTSERVVLLSMDRAKGANVATALMQRQWDLLLVDEAHELRNEDSLRASFVYSLSALNRVYLTATPVQNSGYDIFHIVNSLRPGFLNVKAVFTERYMLDDRSIRDPESLQRSLAKVMLRKRREIGAEGFAKRKVETVFIEAWTEQEQAAYEDLLEMLRGTYRRNLGYAAPIRRSSGMEEHISQFVLVAMLVLREMSSHTRSALKTLNTALRARLEALETAGQKVERISPIGGELGWGLKQLDEFLHKHRKGLDRAEAHAKAKNLISLLKELFKTERSVLVYVCFRETLDALTRLVERHLKHVVAIDYHGELDTNLKTKRLELFKESKTACLLSMDAGGQGLNLQTADTIINYDYPWNPMKVEQRIGRVDRYNQKSPEVRVINLVTKGTIERYVYDTLRTKLEVFEHVVGDMMSPLNVDDVLENKIMLGIGELILSSRSVEEMRVRFDGLDQMTLQGIMDRVGLYKARHQGGIRNELL
jgi:SNF2 family DNA or RNA helicase